MSEMKRKKHTRTVKEIEYGDRKRWSDVKSRTVKKERKLGDRIKKPTTITAENE